MTESRNESTDSSDSLDLGDQVTDRRVLTHLKGGEAHMVDISEKAVTQRVAEAHGTVRMNPETLELVEANRAEKGDVLAVARVAGIMAAKRTSELIPLCHTLPLTSVEIDFSLSPGGLIEIVGRAKTSAQTGVELEALTAVMVAGLTIYDMCKSVDRGMVIGDIRLTYKAGGKSGTFRGDATSADIP